MHAGASHLLICSMAKKKEHEYFNVIEFGLTFIIAVDYFRILV